MLTRVRRFLSYAVGTRFIDIEQESPNRLVLKSGMTRTVFEKASATIFQNSKAVGAFNSISGVELLQRQDQEGPANWLVTVYLLGGKSIEVGQVTDQTDASIIGARISTITGHPVKDRL